MEEDQNQPISKPLTPIASIATPSWKLTTLIKMAFLRIKDRYRAYAEIAFISILVSALTDVWIYIFSVFLSKSSTAFASIEGITVLIEILIFIWLGLAATLILIRNEKLRSVDALMQAKILLKGYLWLILVTFLFLLGLAPISFVLCFFIIIIGFLFFKESIAQILILGTVASFALDILWLFWGSFAGFVYIEKYHRGLKNLWVSRELINQRFWPLFWRITLITCLNLLVYAPFIYLLFKYPDSRTLPALAIEYLFYVVIYLTVTPFTTSFLYEMYKGLSHPMEVKKPKAWIWIAIISTILSIILGALAIGLFIGSYGTDFSSLLESSKTKRLKEKLIKEEDSFQKELGKLNITPVMEIDYKGEEFASCSPTSCTRSLEVIYGGDIPLQEKLEEINKEFVSQGWNFYNATDLNTPEDIAKQFEKNKHVSVYANPTKGDFQAKINFANPNTDVKQCFNTKLCDYAYKQVYPYVFSIKYSLKVTDQSKPSLNKKDSPNSPLLQSILPNGPAPLSLKQQLIKQETIFQKEIGNINISPVLGKK